MKQFVCRFVALIACLVPLHAAPEMVNGVLVIVNDAVITYKDVQGAILKDLQALEARYGHQPQVFAEKARQLEKDRLNELVEAQLILSEFENNPKYQLPDSYIEGRINEDIRHFGDRLTLTKTLQAEGLTYETYRKRVREKIILELMWRFHVPVDPLVSPAKIEKYYNANQDRFRRPDQIKLRMISLNKRPGGPSPLALAQEINAKLADGAPFEEMAKIYSQSSQASSGGDWGWVEKSVLRDELAKVAFTLKAGERSEPIETADSVYILYVEDVRSAHVKKLTEVRDEIEETLKAEENKRLRTQWIEGMKKKSFVRYF